MSPLKQYHVCQYYLMYDKGFIKARVTFLKTTKLLQHSCRGLLYMKLT